MDNLINVLAQRIIEAFDIRGIENRVALNSLLIAHIEEFGSVTEISRADLMLAEKEALELLKEESQANRMAKLFAKVQDNAKTILTTTEMRAGNIVTTSRMYVLKEVKYSAPTYLHVSGEKRPVDLQNMEF